MADPSAFLSVKSAILPESLQREECTHLAKGVRGQKALKNLIFTRCPSCPSESEHMGHRIRHWATSRRAEAFPEIAVLTLCLHSDFLIMKQEDVIEEDGGLDYTDTY